MKLTEIWPPYALEIIAGDLELTIIRDDDLSEFVDLVIDGVHDPDFMPFGFPWTDADPAELPANFARFQWSVRSRFTPEDFSLDFAVRRRGELVGTQALHLKDFAITRTGTTGSWLARRFHRQGIGTAMRQTICAFAFDELGATEITSGAFVDNAPSLGVSRKVGYTDNGINRQVRRGELAEHQNLRLTPDALRRGAPLTVHGADQLRSFLRLAEPGSRPGA